MSDIFSYANTRQAVFDNLAEAQAAIPEGSQRALLIDATAKDDGTTGVRILYASKIGESWQFGAGAGYDGHHVEGKVSLLKAWK